MSDTKEGLDVQELLNTGLVVSLRIRSGVQGLKVPDYLLEQPIFYLEIGYNTPVAIPDLVLTEHGISCTLSFNQVPYYCFIPVDAISGVGGPAVEHVLNKQAQAPQEKPKKERPEWLKVIK